VGQELFSLWRKRKTLLMSSITKVEHELWNIFTYYTLHSDPTQPEHLKVAHFIRFVKDCQIVSKSLIEADIQIMMTREVSLPFLFLCHFDLPLGQE
jgi:hypothetical protein